MCLTCGLCPRCRDRGLGNAKIDGEVESDNCRAVDVAVMDSDRFRETFLLDRRETSKLKELDHHGHRAHAALTTNRFLAAQTQFSSQATGSGPSEPVAGSLGCSGWNARRKLWNEDDEEDSKASAMRRALMSDKS